MAKLRIEVGKELRAKHGFGGSRYTATVNAVCDWAEATEAKVRAAVPTLSYEGYWVASGYELDPRARVKGLGIRKFIVQRARVPGMPGWHFQAFPVLKNLACVFSGKIPDLDVTYPSSIRTSPGWVAAFKTLENEVLNIICLHLEPSLGLGIVLSLEASVAGADRTAAAEQVRKNKEIATVAVRKAAMARLQEEMRRYDFTEDDVLEAWRDSQVRRVQES